jgi:hypothetical protein
MPFHLLLLNLITLIFGELSPLLRSCLVIRPNPKSHFITHNSCYYPTNQSTADQRICVAVYSKYSQLLSITGGHFLQPQLRLTSWPVSNWQKIRCRGGFLWTEEWTFDFHERGKFRNPLSGYQLLSESSAAWNKLHNLFVYAERYAIRNCTGNQVEWMTLQRVGYLSSQKWNAKRGSMLWCLAQLRDSDIKCTHSIYRLQETIKWIWPQFPRYWNRCWFSSCRRLHSLQDKGKTYAWINFFRCSALIEFYPVPHVWSLLSNWTLLRLTVEHQL